MPIASEIYFGLEVIYVTDAGPANVSFQYLFRIDYLHALHLPKQAVKPWFMRTPNYRYHARAGRLAKSCMEVCRHTQVTGFPSSDIDSPVLLGRFFTQGRSEITFNGDLQSQWTIDVAIQCQHVATFPEFVRAFAN